MVFMPANHFVTVSLPLRMEEQRVNIKFCLNLGKSATVAHNLLRQKYMEMQLYHGHMYLNGTVSFVMEERQLKMMLGQIALPNCVTCKMLIGFINFCKTTIALFYGC